jgi:hypothetical protein
VLDEVLGEVLGEVMDRGEFWANTKVLGFKTTAADTTAADLKNLRREMDIFYRSP